MSIRSTREGEKVVIAVEGQLIAGNRQQLRDAVLPEIDRGARHFVIDFADTGYIDSAGLGALVSLSKRIRESDGAGRAFSTSPPDESRRRGLPNRSGAAAGPGSSAHYVAAGLCPVRP